jgi:glucose/arabinose dehydrogenase
VKHFLLGFLALFVALAIGTGAVGLLASRSVLRAFGDSLATERLVTGIVVTGREDAVVLFVSSSDPRIGQVDPLSARKIDTNSGVISRLEQSEGTWKRTDVVRGLPRSRSDHATNGLALSRDGSILFVAQGSNTNRGAPSRSFYGAPEYALSGAILAVAVRGREVDDPELPTLDDPGRTGSQDTNDPFGGAGGANQAIVPPDRRVRIVASGFRNPYDIVVTHRGALYATQNGPNAGYGQAPLRRTSCTNDPVEGGARGRDSLDLVVDGAYFGHPNPTRANRRNRFSPGGDSPVASSDPRQCVTLSPTEVGAVATFSNSTNGVTEYTATNFGGALRGAILTAGLAGPITALTLTEDGRGVRARTTLARVQTPLDVTALGDGGRFPGTVWVTRYDEGASTIVVLEPTDYRAGRVTRPVRFTSSVLRGVSLAYPTSLQFGPDHRLYVAEQTGAILALTIERRGPGRYVATSAERIAAIQEIRNHNDDGSPADGPRHLFETVWDRLRP